jgi:hypothetical protein
MGSVGTPYFVEKDRAHACAPDGVRAKIDSEKQSKKELILNE